MLLSLSLCIFLVFVRSLHTHRGSGRFALLIGLARTGDAVGAAFSNLVGETIAEHGGYSNAFLFLSLAALIPLLIYGFLMPSSRYLTDGTAVDELSISQRSKLSLSNHSTSKGDHDQSKTSAADGIEIILNPVIANE
jgi:predicted MFS family arabinose efflux permease